VLVLVFWLLLLVLLLMLLLVHHSGLIHHGLVHIHHSIHLLIHGSKESSSWTSHHSTATTTSKKWISKHGSSSSSKAAWHSKHASTTEKWIGEGIIISIILIYITVVRSKAIATNAAATAIAKWIPTKLVTEKGFKDRKGIVKGCMRKMVVVVVKRTALSRYFGSRFVIAIVLKSLIFINKKLVGVAYFGEFARCCLSVFLVGLFVWMMNECQFSVRKLNVSGGGSLFNTEDRIRVVVVFHGLQCWFVELLSG